MQSYTDSQTMSALNVSVLSDHIWKLIAHKINMKMYLHLFMNQRTTANGSAVAWGMY